MELIHIESTICQVHRVIQACIGSGYSGTHKPTPWYAEMIPDIEQGSLLYTGNPCMLRNKRWAGEPNTRCWPSRAPSTAAVPSAGCWAAGCGAGVPPHLEGAQSRRGNGEARGALPAGGEPGVPLLHPSRVGGGNHGSRAGKLKEKEEKEKMRSSPEAVCISLQARFRVN